MQTLTVVVIQITLIRIRKITGLVSVNNDAWRIVTTGMSILKLNLLWWLLSGRHSELIQTGDLLRYREVRK